MHQLKPISDTVYPSQPSTDTTPWQRIYKFALAAWIFGLLSLALMASGFLPGFDGNNSKRADNAVVKEFSQYASNGEISVGPDFKNNSFQPNQLIQKKP